MREWRIAVTGGESSDEKVAEVFRAFPIGLHQVIHRDLETAEKCMPFAESSWPVPLIYAADIGEPITDKLRNVALVNDGFDILVVFKGYDEDLVKRAAAAGRQILWAEEEP